MASSTLSMEAGPSRSTTSRPLALEEYERYGRQMILPGWGLPGQLKLKAARVAVVGAGGLGCPVLQYLAGAGVGTIDIFDHDTVSASNLHRQVLHTTERVGMNKAESAAMAMKALNPYVKPIAHPEPITSSSALNLLRPAQIIIDCTDRPLTRYLLSDASVRLGVPLVSGAAISSAGQWAVYGGISGPSEDAAGTDNDRKGKRRACYRCIWPQVLAGSNGRCEDVGVWGVVTGMIGTGMASEVLKLILDNTDEQPLLHLLHLHQTPLIRTIRLKPPSPKCIACAPEATITDDLDSVGYEAFCGGAEVDEESGMREGVGNDRISVQILKELMPTDHKYVVIVDVRPKIEFEICSLPHSHNMPLDTIKADTAYSVKQLHNWWSNGSTFGAAAHVLFICKQGNDSQIAMRSIEAFLAESLRWNSASAGPFMSDRWEVSLGQSLGDVRGGLRAWSRQIDPSFPLY